MLTPNRIKNDLIRTTETFRKLIISSNFICAGNIVSWPRYIPGINDSILYAKNYELLRDEQQYSLLLKDGSFIQVFYEFNGNDLHKARLAYYPFPIRTKETVEDLYEYHMEANEDELENHYAELIKEAEEYGDLFGVNTSHMRIDYDSNVDVHSKCHLQVGSLNHIRVSSKVLISPFLFCGLIIRNTFPREFELIKSGRKFKVLYKYSKLKEIIFDHTCDKNNMFITLE